MTTKKELEDVYKNNTLEQFEGIKQEWKQMLAETRGLVINLNNLGGKLISIMETSKYLEKKIQDLEYHLIKDNEEKV